MDHQISRRTLTRGAAWTAPAVALAGAAPALAASPTLDPGVTVETPITCFTDAGSSDGYIVPGVVVTVADEDGQPVANTSVDICVSEGSWPGNENTFWFVADPTLASDEADDSENRQRCGTFVTDANGQIALDDGAGSGYLRKGTDGEARGTTFTVTSTAGTTTFTLTNSSVECNGGSTGTRPVAG